MKTISVSGRCRCGRLQFVLREEPIAFYLCHCTDCQTESGSAFGQSMAVRREAIDTITGPGATIRSSMRTGVAARSPTVGTV